MIVPNNEVVTFQHEISLINRTGTESNGCKEICLNVNEHRVLKKIKTIINKFWTSIFAKKWRGHGPPAPLPSSEALFKRHQMSKSTLSRM